VDSEPLAGAVKALAAGQDLASALKHGVPPDLGKRGTLRTVFDGRYKFSRYFAPVARNRPRALDELYRDNDVELFDLETDPGETTNLAARRGEHADLLLAMSAKLEAQIKAEIGVDDGREMPPLQSVTWTLDVKGGQTILD
jgi:arylsulfatase